MSDGYGYTLEDRASDGCCIVCSQPVGLYYCTRCAINSHYEGARVVASEMRAPNATQMGRALQRRVDSAAEYEQLTQLWSVIEHTSPVMPDGSDITCSQSVLGLRRGSALARKRVSFKAGRSSYRVYQRFCEGWTRLAEKVVEYEPKRRARSARSRANMERYWSRVRGERALEVWRAFSPMVLALSWAWLDAATLPESRSAA